MSEQKCVLNIMFLENLGFHAKEFGFYFVCSKELQKVFEQGVT